jgi:hypothetical protein
MAQWLAHNWALVAGLLCVVVFVCMAAAAWMDRRDW